MKPQPVVAVPLTNHLGVDDNPAFGVGASLVSDPELAAGRRGPAVGGDHIRGAQTLEGVGAQVRQHQFDVEWPFDRTQTFVFEQHLDVGKPGDALAEHVVDRGLVQELLRRMPAAARASWWFR